MNEQAAANPLGTERVGKLMIRYAIPSIISIVVNSLYNMVDQIFIGQGVGYLGNAATNVIMPLTTILMAIAFMLGDGAAAYMSLNLGKNRPDDAARGVGNLITLTIGTGSILLILFQLFLEPLCGSFGATEGNLPYALDYGRIIVLGFPFSAVCSAFGSVIRADGRPRASMIGLLIGCATNIILDPIFIFVCQWGVKGAAWATILGQILNAAFFAACMFRFKTIKLKREYFIPKLQIARRLASLGVSSLISQIASVFVIAVTNNLLVTYGVASLYGPDIPMAAFFIFQIFPEQIIDLFGKESELYIEFAVTCFRVYLLACFLIPAGAVTGIFFQAIGKPVPATLLSEAVPIDKKVL